MYWYVYILRCDDGRLYTGATSDVERRMREHQRGVGGRFTRANKPTKLMYYERHASEHEAKKREAQIKFWSRAEKLALVAGERDELKRV